MYSRFRYPGEFEKGQMFSSLGYRLISEQGSSIAVSLVLR